MNDAGLRPGGRPRSVGEVGREFEDQISLSNTAFFSAALLCRLRYGLSRSWTDFRHRHRALAGFPRCPCIAARPGATLRFETNLTAPRRLQMSAQEPEEAQRRYAQAMGADLGRLYYLLWNEFAWLYSNWGEYVALFGTKQSRIELINRAAGQFFGLVQETLWDDTLLHLARLTDPPTSGGKGKENLTIRGLPALIRDEEIRQEVTALVAIATENTEFCRDWRNRYIAHRDLRLAEGEGAEPLKPASRALIVDALKSIADLLNALAQRYLDSTTAFEGVGSLSGALSLLYVIDDGLRMKRDRDERMRAGDYRPEDYELRDL
jgi:hypothetical protein